MSKNQSINCLNPSTNACIQNMQQIVKLGSTEKNRDRKQMPTYTKHDRKSYRQKKRPAKYLLNTSTVYWTSRAWTYHPKPPGGNNNNKIYQYLYQKRNFLRGATDLLNKTHNYGKIQAIKMEGRRNKKRCKKHWKGNRTKMGGFKGGKIYKFPTKTGKTKQDDEMQTLQK
eukprot:TRINITY_DN29157_c0_g1_i4.p3 TRINITY_DN29157_c0_g1~~TRINITY_DN29157_c0_g1_i4.p3  ORF type:complete len:170 (-),score=12.91 TRINITY_DN29157_c0_g1_i4:156-665(-)